MDYKLLGKSVVVTGASKGIGKGIAAAFAREGSAVLVVARGEKSAESTVEEIRSLGGKAEFMVADISSAQECKLVVERAVDLHGGIDVVCANAGIFPECRVRDMGEAELTEIFATNVFGTILIVKEAIAALERSSCGRIVLTSSITGPITGSPGWSHYGATKAAQLGFMRTAALELAPTGITINAVLPGNVLTEGLADLGEEYLATMAAAVPLGYLGSVDDIASACLFLSSPGARYITGQTIVVDGGQTLPESLSAIS